MISSQTRGRGHSRGVEGIFYTIELMVVIIQIQKKKKNHMEPLEVVSIYKIHIPRPMRIIVIDVIGKGIGCVYVVRLNI